MGHIALVGLMVVILTGTRTLSISTNLDIISQGNEEFANALYSVLSKSKGTGNVFFSPLSVHTILALAYLGAGGETAKQMAAGLHLPNDPELVRSSFQQLLKQTRGNPKHLLVAHKIYLDKAVHFNVSFSKVAEQYFLSEVQNLDFSSSSSVDIVNNWVDEKTHHKIPKIISDDGLIGRSLVLVNAVHCKGQWKRKFKESHTTTQPFYLTKKETKNVQMMRIQGDFQTVHHANESYNSLDLPYESGTSMVILLPHERGVEALNNLEKHLRTRKLHDIVDELNKVEPSRDLVLRLPKFKLEERATDLTSALVNLGMVDMTGEKADFSGLAREKLKVNEVLHKAVVEVNEEGTEAADATDVSPVFLSIPPQFTADHPFLFFIYCHKYNVVLFMGRYTTPPS